jgi:hypothetical protein
MLREKHLIWLDRIFGKPEQLSFVRAEIFRNSSLREFGFEAGRKHERVVIIESN